MNREDLKGRRLAGLTIAVADAVAPLEWLGLVDYVIARDDVGLTIGQIIDRRIDERRNAIEADFANAAVDGDVDRFNFEDDALAEKVLSREAEATRAVEVDLDTDSVICSHDWAYDRNEHYQLRRCRRCAVCEVKGPAGWTNA